VPHGVLTGVFLRSGLLFNASVPSKITPNPNVKSYLAPRKLAQFGEMMGFGGGVEGVVEQVAKLQRGCGLPLRLRDAGVSEADFRIQGGREWTASI
jgi:alcohol dehydrogenase class IV